MLTCMIILVFKDGRQKKSQWFDVAMTSRFMFLSLILQKIRDQKSKYWEMEKNSTKIMNILTNHNKWVLRWPLTAIENVPQSKHLVPRCPSPLGPPRPVGQRRPRVAGRAWVRYAERHLAGAIALDFDPRASWKHRVSICFYVLQWFQWLLL